MKSLFIVSLPRSLSSLTFHIARMALELREPSWTSDGEVLNPDRFTSRQPGAPVSRLKYMGSQDPESVSPPMQDFLEKVLPPEGFACKDVVQPFFISSWLRNKDFPVLRIQRDLAEVAYAMLAREWFYPEVAATRRDDDVETRVIEGLVRASAALDELKGAFVIQYEQLVTDESALWRGLSALYPSYPVPLFYYLDDSFKKGREFVVARRDPQRFEALKEKVRAVSARLTTRAELAA